MAPIKNSNPKVSDAIMKALGNDTRGRPQISAAEMKAIKQTAAREIRNSDKPTSTLKTIQSSFELANRITGGEYKAKFSEVGTELKDLAARKQQNSRQVDTSNWNRPTSNTSSGSTT